MDDLRVFEKLVSLRARSRACLNAIQSLAQGEEYTATLKTAEAWLTAVAETQSPQPPEPLCGLLKSSTALQQLFRTEPLFGDAAPEIVAELSAFCDLSPDPATGLTSANGPFRRAAAATIKGMAAMPAGEQVVVNDLIRDGLTKLYWLDLADVRVVPHLVKLAGGGAWQEQSSAIEHCLGILREGRSLGKDDLAKLQRPARAVVDRVQRGLRTAGPAAELLLALRASPHLDELLANELALFVAVRDRRKELARSLAAQFAHTTPQEKARFIAEKAFPLLPQVARERVAFCLRLRVIVARAAWENRAFAKLYALEEGWESLAEQFRANQSPLLEFETRLNQPGTAMPPLESQEGSGSPTDLDRLRQAYQEDQALTALLTAQPMLGEIVRTMPEVLDFFAISRSLVKVPRVAVEAAPAPTAPVQKTGVGSEEHPATVNVHISMKAPRPNEPDSSGKTDVAIELTFQGMEPVEHSLAVNLASIWSMIFDHLALYRRSFQRRVIASLPPSAAETSRPTRTQAPVPPQLDTSDGLRAVGELLFAEFFKEKVWPEITKRYGPQSRLRLILEFPQVVQPRRAAMPTSLADLPWESLYVPDVRIFVGLINRYSLVRARGKLQQTTPSFGPELRILAVLAQPLNAPPIQIERHRHMLEQQFERASQSGAVRYELIAKPTVDNLLDSLRTFRPNVFHFYGHGVFDTKAGEGAIMLVDDEGNLRLVFAEDMRNWFMNLNNPIQLALINACESATTSGGDVITGVAGALSDAGVPATIATTSQVFIETADSFTSVFYRALFSAYTVEAAVTEARNVLHASRVDWAPYAIFANTENLDGLRLHRVLSE
jgi:hypothetical protein